MKQFFSNLRLIASITNTGIVPTMVYVALLRGINVGGKNKISMAELKSCFEELGYDNVRTYINSGNVIFSTGEPAGKITKKIEADILNKFPHTTMPIKVLVLSRGQLAAVIKKAPQAFGEHPEKFHSDVAFLIGKKSTEAMEQVTLHPEVDKAWPGERVVYFQRLSARLTSSRINKIAGTPIYKFMTIRTWTTVQKLASLMEKT